MNHPNDSALPPNAPICPLARDADGNPIELPPVAAAWRVRRKTGGRPRIVLGVDKQPMQLPLGYTIVDLEDVLAPAEYLLDIVDGKKGEPLGITVAVAIGQLRNAGDEAPDDTEPAVVASMLPTTGSETRLVLEANVRATQLAFQHNQKTLELGLHMAETLRDSVRDMATAQADWIKAAAQARGFFRNASPPVPPPAPAPEPPDESDDEEDDEPVAEPHWVDKLMPHVASLAQVVVPMVVAWGSRKTERVKTKFQWGDLLNWQRAAERANAVDVEPSAAPPEARPALPPLDPADMAHFIAIQSALTPEEAKVARAIAGQLSPDELRGWFAELRQQSVPDAVAKIRTLISGTAKPAA